MQEASTVLRKDVESVGASRNGIEELVGMTPNASNDLSIGHNLNDWLIAQMKLFPKYKISLKGHRTSSCASDKGDLVRRDNGLIAFFLGIKARSP